VKPNRYNPEGKTSQVAAMFDSISAHYDMLNGVLSLGVDKFWRRVLLKRAARQQPAAALDVATGTGDVAIALKQKSGARRVVGVDISEEMLAVARKKKQDADIEFVTANGELLPFEDGTFDVVSIAFGIRNFEDRVKGLEEMRRVLRSGGTLLVLELSLPTNLVLRGLYKLYFFGLLPLVGRLISRSAYAYRYLPLSVGEFPPRKKFVEEIRQAGFSQAAATPLTLGLATLYEAKK
jgi:demethylmenaquinone methyltransferase/2-methoxy-6-polyprenyl-1,4-benzoquinol methylase